MRSALIGMRLAEELRCCRPIAAALFYALLLKDLGCSSNAAKMAYLFGADDHIVKRSARMIDWTQAGPGHQALLEAVCPGRLAGRKAAEDGGHRPDRRRGRRKIAEVRCERGAEIARLRCNSPRPPPSHSRISTNIGTAKVAPADCKGDQISLLGQDLLPGPDDRGLLQHLRPDLRHWKWPSSRRGRWFDPRLVDVLLTRFNGMLYFGPAWAVTTWLSVVA